MVALGFATENGESSHNMSSKSQCYQKLCEFFFGKKSELFYWEELGPENWNADVF